MPFGRGMNPLIPSLPAMDYFVPLVFSYKYGFGIK